MLARDPNTLWNMSLEDQLREEKEYDRRVFAWKERKLRDQVEHQARLREDAERKLELEALRRAEEARKREDAERKREDAERERKRVESALEQAITLLMERGMTETEARRALGLNTSASSRDP